MNYLRDCNFSIIGVLFANCLRLRKDYPKANLALIFLDHERCEQLRVTNIRLGTRAILKKLTYDRDYDKNAHRASCKKHAQGRIKVLQG